MKIIKSDHLGLIATTWTFAGLHELVLSMFACFPLSPDGSTPLVEESAMWAAIAEVLGPQGIFDAGRPKPRAEFLVYGNCIPPTATEACPVVACVGQLRKSLMVYGDRSRELDEPGRPRPFSVMPLIWENAYGGPDVPDNPAGKGSLKDKTGQIPIPNIIPASGNARTGDIAPACLGAIPAGWRPRTSFLGPIDRKWIREDAPGLPASTDPRFHMTAQKDQWLEGFLIGTEEFEISGMNANRPQISGRLPGFRARAFVTGPGDDLSTFREIPARADTLWLFPNQELGIVCYRACLKIQDEQADDVAHVLLDFEALASEPLPAATYRERLKHELFPPEEPVAEQPEEPPLPEPEHPAPEQVPDPVRAEQLAEQERITAGALKSVQAESREMLNRMGYTEEQARELVAQFEAKSKLWQQALPDKSLDELLAESKAQSKAFLARHGMTPEQAIEAIQQKQPQFKPPTLADIDQMLAQGQITPELAGHLRDAHEALAALLALGMTGRDSKTPQLPEQSPQEPDSTPSVSEMARDMTGQNFSGQNLSGQDFSGAILEKANFDGADLSRAVFANAVLTGASFRSARCTEANFVDVTANDADFEGADLTRADLTGSDFTGGRFEQVVMHAARCTGTVFESARMAGLQGKNLLASGADFSRADLTGAVLESATLTEATVAEANLENADLSGILAVNVRLGGARLRGALCSGALLEESRADAETSFENGDLQGIRAAGAQWSGVNLESANLEGAALDGADLSRARLGGSVLTRCLARGADFAKSLLDRANLTGINLMDASLANASLRDTRVNHANCFGADFHGAILTGASFDKTNVKRTLLDPERENAI